MYSQRTTSKLDIGFDTGIGVLMVLFCFTTLYPFMYLLSLSLTPSDVSMTEVYLIPPRLVLDNYRRVLSSDSILLGFVNTVYRTVLGTLVQLIAIICTAYPLSKRYYPHRSLWTGFIVFTMFFSGGLIPGYLLVKSLGMMNSVWSMIIPGLIPTFTMIIVRNFFMALPDSLEESARIDGANDFVILFRIILPVSLPIIATVVLWQTVGHWNAWFDCMIYIQDAKKQVLQIVLRRIVLQGTQDMVQINNSAADNMISLNPESIKAATIIVTMLPIISVYPFVQKYFIQGIMVGSLKG